jgi:hypothetical protein
MYLYLQEEVTGHCGDYIESVGHLINLDSLPVEGEDRQVAQKELYEVAYGWIFDKLVDDPSGCSPDSTWEYNQETKKWVETQLTTSEQRQEERNKMWRI